MTGMQIALKLKPEGTVILPSSDGDWYDPVADVVRLSPATQRGTDAVSLARATHECGHAMQRHYGTLCWRGWRMLPVTKPLWWLCVMGSAGAWILGGHQWAWLFAAAAILLSAFRWLVVLLLEREASRLALSRLSALGATQDVDLDLMEAKMELQRMLRTYAMRS